MTPGQEVPVAPPAGAPAWRAVASLALIAAVAGTIVGLAWEGTRERIAANESLRLLAELGSVLPADRYDNRPQDDMVRLDLGDGELTPVYRARLHGQPSAAVLTVTAPDGYVGPIRLLVAMATDGRVLGVRVLEHTETPGVGDAIDEQRSPWIRDFIGRSLDDPPEAGWRPRQDGGQFDAIAGATISSRAVINGVRRAVQYFGIHQAEIFAAPAVGNQAK